MPSKLNDFDVERRLMKLIASAEDVNVILRIVTSLCLSELYERGRRAGYGDGFDKGLHEGLTTREME